MSTSSDFEVEERLLQEENLSDNSADRYLSQDDHLLDPPGQRDGFDDNDSDDAFLRSNRNDDLDLASELPPQEGADFGMYLASDGQYRARQIDPAVGIGADESAAKDSRAQRRQDLAEYRQAQERQPAAGLLIDEESEAASESAETGDEAPAVQPLPAPAIPDMIPDIAGGRAMQAKTSAWNRVAEVGSTMQGQTNTARMRGEGRYGAAALHGVGNFLAKTGDNAAGITAAAALPLNLAGTLAAPVKATTSKVVGALGQTVEGVSDFAKNRIDPDALAEQQSLIDVANRHNRGNDSAGGGTGMNRREEADAYGVRFEKGADARKLWGGRKKRSAGRIAENFLSAPVRGLASLPMGIWKGAKAIGGLFTNTIPKYGRKFANWVGSNRFSTARRGRQGFENMMAVGNRDEARKRQDAAYLGRDLGMMEQKRANEDPDRQAKKSWLSRTFFKGPDKAAWRGKDDPGAWRGAEAQVRHAARVHLHATGRDLMLGRKEFNSLNAYDRKMYKSTERNRVQNSPEYQKALDSQNTEAIARVRAQLAAQEPAEEAAEQPVVQESAESQPLGESALLGDADPAADFEMPEAAATNPDLVPHEESNSSSTLMATGKFLEEKVNKTKDKALKAHKGVAQILPVAKFMGEKVPAMLNSNPDMAEAYAPVQQGAQEVGGFIEKYVKKPMDDANALTGVKQLPLVPLVSDGLTMGADLIQTGAQYKHRKDDPNATGHHERQGVQDLRTMLHAQQALEHTEAETGATDQQTRARTRRKLRAAMRLAVANQKLAKAQTKAGLTPRNEYSHKEEEFINTGTFQKDKTANSRLYNALFAKKGSADPAPEAAAPDPIVDMESQSADIPVTDDAVTDDADTDTDNDNDRSVRRAASHDLDDNDADAATESAHPVSEHITSAQPGKPRPSDFRVWEDEGSRDVDNDDADVQQHAESESEGSQPGNVDLKGLIEGLDAAGLQKLPAGIDDLIGDGESSRSSSDSSDDDSDGQLIPPAISGGGAPRRHSQGQQAVRPTSLTNVPDMDFDQPLDDFMYPPENVDAYNEYMHQKFVDEGKDPSEVPSYHNFAKAREEKSYPDMAATEKTKRVLDDSGNLRADDPGIQAHMGPTTVAGREVYPEYGSVDDPRAAFGGNWRDLGTDQVLQYAGRTRDDAQNYGEFYRDALPDNQILDKPADGWDNLGKKPGLFAGKQAKNDYTQRAENARAIVTDAYAKARSGGMPSFIKSSALGRAEWNAAEQARKAKEAALRERIRMGRPNI